MDMLADGVNIGVALVTIVLGLFGWLKVNDTLNFVGLQPADGSGLGKSEIRAASGALWVGMGVGALLLFSATAFVMLGCLYTGAAVGRATSIIVDQARSPKPLLFLTYEVVCATLLLAINLPALS